MTPIEQLRPLTPITPLASAETKGYDAGLVGELADQTPFGMIFRSAIENVVETDAAKTKRNTCFPRASWIILPA